MKQLFRNKFFIAFLLVGMVFLALMAWGLHKSKDTMGLKLDIPELEGELVKDIYFENDSLVIQVVSIFKEETVDYLMLKAITSDSLNKLKQDKRFQVGETSYLEVYGFKIWDYPTADKNVNFRYYTKQLPVEEIELSDTLLIQKFENMDMEISLTGEEKRDLGLNYKKPSTLVLYKKENNLYFIVASKPFDWEDHWIPQDELVTTVYLLVKNWDVYERR